MRQRLEAEAEGMRKKAEAQVPSIVEALSGVDLKEMLDRVRADATPGTAPAPTEVQVSPEDLLPLDETETNAGANDTPA